MRSANRRLIALVSPFIAVLVIQTAIAILSFELLSAVRGYVAGESQWSKGHKDAVHYLKEFGLTGDRAIYDRFERAIAIPLADKAARLALEAPTIDLQRAAEGFLGGGNHPDDIPGLIRAFRYFRSYSYIAKAVDHWRATDPLLEELLVLGRSARGATALSTPSPIEYARFQEQVDRLDRALAPHALGFSEALGEASRAITTLLISVNALIAALLIAIVVVNARRLLIRSTAFEEALLQERERAIEKGVLLQAVVDNFPGGITFMDADLRMVLANENGRRLLDLPDVLFAAGPPTIEEVFRFNAERGEYGLGDVEEQVAARMALARQNRAHVFERKRPDGTVIEVRGVPLAKGGFVTTYTDVTERRRAEAEIARMAYHDRLTGLANRTLLGERVEQALALTQRGQVAALHLIDLDHFKAVNDTQGHLSGDALLREAARRLSDLVRATDTVARMGGDEYAIVQLGLKDATCAAVLAERVVAKLSEPYVLDGRQIHVGASVGIAMLPQDGRTTNEVMSHADLALYASKGQGRSRFSFFERELSCRALARLELRDDLRTAVAHNQCEVHYQPVIDIETRQVIAREALLRWRHPTKGMIPPSLFIPIAEEHGLIGALTEWVLRTACRDVQCWPETERVAVNLSPVQFRMGDVVASVRAALRATGTPPHRLELEVTESALLDAKGGTMTALTELRDLGVTVALDDFGTGYSSLSYLTTFSLDKLKIDRSFVAGMESSSQCAAVVAAIAQLGRSLGLKTTAEGVETEQQLAFVRAAGFDFAQGYLFGAPKRFEAPTRDGSLAQSNAA